MKPEEARIGMWVSVSLTGQIVGIEPMRLNIRVSGFQNCEIPVEAADIISKSETLAHD